MFIPNEATKQKEIHSQEILNDPSKILDNIVKDSHILDRQITDRFKKHNQNITNNNDHNDDLCTSKNSKIYKKNSELSETSNSVRMLAHEPINSFRS